MRSRCLRGAAFNNAIRLLFLISLQSVATESTTSSSAGDTVVNGVLHLISTEAQEACDTGCKTGLAEAFDVGEDAIACLCPGAGRASSSSSSRRRRLYGSDWIFRHRNNPVDASFGPGAAGYLRGLQESEGDGGGSQGAAFFARIPGGLEAGIESLEVFSDSWATVAEAFGVGEDELELSTLTVTPPTSAENGALSIIAQNADASDIDIIGISDGGGDDLAGGSKGVALFLSLLVLVVGTACCGFCFLSAFGHSSKHRDSKAWLANRKGPGGNRNTYDSRSKGSSISSSPPDQDANGSLSMDSPCGSPVLLTPVQESAEETTTFRNPFGRTKGSGEASIVSSARGGSGNSAAASALDAGGSAGTGAGVTLNGNASVSSAGNPRSSSEGNESVSGIGRGAGLPSSSGVGSTVLARTPGGGVDVESRGTNPLYKTVAPLSRGANGGAAATAPLSGKTGKVMDTPTRSRFGGFLGNVTPARLRRLAGRAMSSRSPAHSGGSHGRSSSGGSGTSGKGSRGSRHRRDRSFPGKYDQKNSSEMDHQRPPADPVYTFMIKTIAGKGFKFMTTTEIAFCAMRMYSHFRRTEGNFKRLAVMKHAENVPPVYEIIWLCDTAADQVSGGQSRFFSASPGTDAEQQKSLLACLLALQWNGTYSSRRALERALTPTNVAEVPGEEDVFWDDFKDSTDALSGNDVIVLLAQLVLLVANSNRQPGQSLAGASRGAVSGGDLAAGGSMSKIAQSAPSPTASDSVKPVSVDHGDIMRALSGAHLREVGIAVKATRRGWQEAHVQLVSVLLVVNFLEDAARHTPSSVKKPDALSSLDWIMSLTSKDLDTFLIEKLEVRRKLVELDLQPSGLIIKHDEDGHLERVEPAVLEKKASETSSRVGTRSSSRSRRAHRRMISSGSNSSSVERVVITTINRRQQSGSDSAAGRPSSIDGTATVSSTKSATTMSNTATAPAAPASIHSGLRTIAQVRATSSAGSGSNPSPGQKRKSSPTVRRRPSARLAEARAQDSGSNEGGASGSRGDAMLPPLTVLGRGFSGTSERPSERVRAPVAGTGGVSGRGVDGYAGVSTAGESVRSPLSNAEPSESDYYQSEASSVVTRVYAPSQMDDSGHGQIMRNNRFNSWANNTDADGQDSVILGASTSPGGLASPLNNVAMSQVSIAASRYDRSPSSGVLHLLGGGFGSLAPAAIGAQSPGSASVAASRFEEQAAPSEVNARDAGDAAGGVPVSNRRSAFSRLDPTTPTSAAGSRFPDSPSSYADSRLPGSPTGEQYGHDHPYTGRSNASSMRSGSFFPENQSSTRSGLGSGGVQISSASGSSWDEEDLQNIGARWLSDRAFNQNKYTS